VSSGPFPYNPVPDGDKSLPSSVKLFGTSTTYPTLTPTISPPDVGSLSSSSFPSASPLLLILLVLVLIIPIGLYFYFYFYGSNRTKGSSVELAAPAGYNTTSNQAVVVPQQEDAGTKLIYTWFNYKFIIFVVFTLR
jgi:hypothetical protein